VRTKNIGLAAAAVTVALGAAACESSSTKTASSPAAHPTSAASQRSTPTPTRSAGPLTTDQLKDGLLNAETWGSGWTDDEEGPLIKTSDLGTVSQIAGEDCWTALFLSARVGSQAAVEDVLDSHSGDVGHQSTYQFGPGDAKTSLTEVAKKVNDCGTFKHTDDNGMAFTEQAHEEPVPGLGDQATKNVVTSVSAQSGTDVLVDLRVRYGDTVIDVGYDSSIATTAEQYDLAGKVQAIAANLGLKAAGS